MNEQFSAFLDGEATRDEVDSVLHSLLHDEQMRNSWTRQHWVRASLRSHDVEPEVALDVGFSDRVMAAIANEDNAGQVPATLTAAPGNRARVINMPRRTRVRRWRGVAGMAAAASVAGVVLLSGNPFMRSSSSGSEGRVAEAGGSSSQATQLTSEAESRRRHSFASADNSSRLEDFQTISSSGRTRSVAARGNAGHASAEHVVASRGGPSDHWSVSDPDVRNELNGYLAYHSGMARGFGVPSTTPAMVRVAGYGQGLVQ